MVTRSENARPFQNMGLADRALRIVIGAALLAGGSLSILEAGAAGTGMMVLMVISIYPLLTAIIGADPFYAATGYRSCNDSGRNQCGTFPYQVKAALGRAPKYCEASDEHSLESCHDEPREKPRHAAWQVDREPALYPDDDTMKEYADRERNLKQSRS